MNNERSEVRQDGQPSESRLQYRQVSRDEDLTWLDFLRTAGGTVPNARSSSSDRKRRYTGGSSPERRQPYYPGRRPHGMSSSSNPAGTIGNSTANPIDLTSPPRQQPRLLQRSSGSSQNMGREGSRPHMAGSLRGINGLPDRRESDIVLPRWQADTEVDRCPVCQTEFSFWYRKHHCRKCGRIVCAACSPHRITIPRQYIVQPPNSSDSEETATSPVTGAYGRNLGGGEVVRVCNPCVPDPWTPDAPPGSRPTADDVRRESANDIRRPERYHPVPPPPPFTERFGRARAHSQQSVTTQNRTTFPHGHANSGYVFRDNRGPPSPTSIRPVSHRHSQSASGSNPAIPPIPPFNVGSRHAHPPPAPLVATQPRQIREIPEEDECPVCGHELPAGDNVREAHIQQCITSRFSSTPSSSTPHSLPTPAIASVPTRPATSTPTDGNRARATSYRPRGMAIYRATEKDCLNTDGEPQECVICFEEFQPGEELGRMECLCKFHRVCIRGWWERKGGGVCPTHMLHD